MSSEFAGLVRAARKRRGWTQYDLGAESGVGRRTVVRWESGQSQPTIEQLRIIIRLLDIAADDLLRAVGLLPDEGNQPISDDPDEQAIWNLGIRRGWPRALCQDLIDFYRVRSQRYDDEDAEPDDADYYRRIAAESEAADEATSPHSQSPRVTEM